MLISSYISQVTIHPWRSQGKYELEAGAKAYTMKGCFLASWYHQSLLNLLFFYSPGPPVQECYCQPWAGLFHINHYSWICLQAIPMEAFSQLGFLHPCVSNWQTNKNFKQHIMVALSVEACDSCLLHGLTRKQIARPEAGQMTTLEACFVAQLHQLGFPLQIFHDFPQIAPLPRDNMFKNTESVWNISHWSHIKRQFRLKL